MGLQIFLSFSFRRHFSDARFRPARLIVLDVSAVLIYYGTVPLKIEKAGWIKAGTESVPNDE